MRTLVLPLVVVAACGSATSSMAVMTVDVLDPTTGERRFHGFARDVLRGEDVTAEQIERAVERILEPVPAAAQR